MENIILTDRPTQSDLDRAEKERLMIFTFIPRPESVVDYETSKAFLEGWLMGLGIKPNHRLALVIVLPEHLVDYTMEEYKKRYIESLNDSVNSYRLTFSGFSLPVVNLTKEGKNE